jgi:hypothetical protein
VAASTDATGVTAETAAFLLSSVSGFAAGLAAAAAGAPLPDGPGGQRVRRRVGGAPRGLSGVRRKAGRGARGGRVAHLAQWPIGIRCVVGAL